MNAGTKKAISPLRFKAVDYSLLAKYSDFVKFLLENEVHLHANVPIKHRKAFVDKYELFTGMNVNGEPPPPGLYVSPNPDRWHVTLTLTFPTPTSPWGHASDLLDEELPSRIFKPKNTQGLSKLCYNDFIWALIDAAGLRLGYNYNRVQPIKFDWLPIEKTIYYQPAWTPLTLEAPADTKLDIRTGIVTFATPESVEVSYTYDTAKDIPWKQEQGETTDANGILWSSQGPQTGVWSNESPLLLPQPPVIESKPGFLERFVNLLFRVYRYIIG